VRLVVLTPFLDILAGCFSKEAVVVSATGLNGRREIVGIQGMGAAGEQLASDTP